MTRVLVRSMLPVLLLLVSPAWADYSALSSSAYTYCYFEASNVDGANCVDSGLVLGGDCSGVCNVPGSYGQVSGRLPWEINGEGQMIYGDVGFWTYSIIHGDRISEDIFRVSGACAYADADYAGPPEMSVFHFDGDPAVLEGTTALSVYDFVDLGLIEASDVLYVNACENGGQFDVDLDATGIPDEHLVVFAGAPVSPGDQQSGPVPAVSPLGMALLSVLLLGTGAAILHKRARRQRD